MDEESFRSAWSECRRCGLGVLRNNRTIYDAKRQLITPLPVLGDVSTRGGFLFVVEPAGESEEAWGSVAKHPRYNPIRVAMESAPGVPYTITHNLACRCAVTIRGEDGAPMKAFDGTLRVRDVEPQKAYTDACRDRLMQEIYLRDPFLVLTCGRKALNSLNPRVGDVAPGKLFSIPVPGEAEVPLPTPKGAWGRRVKGGMTYPTQKSQVQYRALHLPSMSDLQTYGASSDTDREKMVFVRSVKQALQMWSLKERMHVG